MQSKHQCVIEIMNGFTTEDESRGDEAMDTNQRLGSNSSAAGAAAPSGSATNHSQICCLLDRGERCGQVAGNASYNKRISKTGRLLCMLTS